jgi:hypothetical protein
MIYNYIIKNDLLNVTWNSNVYKISFLKLRIMWARNIYYSMQGWDALDVTQNTHNLFNGSSHSYI